MGYRLLGLAFDLFSHLKTFAWLETMLLLLSFYMWKESRLPLRLFQLLFHSVQGLVYFS